MSENWSNIENNSFIMFDNHIYNPSNDRECFLAYNNSSGITDSGIWCSSAWDEFFCWPPTIAGAVINRTCTEIFASVNMPSFDDTFDTFDDMYPQKAAIAYRICDINGQWLWGNWTNYTECLQILPHHSSKSVQLFVGYILFICSIVSLILLVITLFIFFYFKTLICSRLRVHRNLVVALIIHSFLLIVISSPLVLGSTQSSYREIEWLCKLVLSVKLYAALACINWMFIEGLLLHSRITTSIFRRDAPFKLYYCLGWGMPFLIIVIWIITMSYTLSSKCWAGYGDSLYVWILTGPMITALLVNCIFLINIIRILVTKLRLTISVEMAQIRKAIKATALLFPLLGISHLLFCVNPGDNGNLEDAYMITNAFLQSSQGIFVSILYCFLNTEVQTVIRNAYLRASVRRRAHPNMKFSFIRQNSCNRRSRFLSQTSASFVSHWEVGLHQNDNNVIDDQIELNDVKPSGTHSDSKKSANKLSIPQSRKCLLYSAGEIVRWKDSMVCANGNNQSENKQFKIIATSEQDGSA